MIQVFDSNLKFIEEFDTGMNNFSIAIHPDNNNIYVINSQILKIFSSIL
jgi:hypothetical protein